MTRRIVKHANRRLYDAQVGRSITLLELSDLVAQGERVVVELKGTGEDITAITLLASVIERMKRRPGALRAQVAERLASAVRRAVLERPGHSQDDVGEAPVSGEASRPERAGAGCEAGREG